MNHIKKITSIPAAAAEQLLLKHPVGEGKIDRKVLSTEGDEHDESLIRIQWGQQVKYVVIQPGVYDYRNVMMIPSALLEALPPFPMGHWNTMNISKHGTNVSHVSLPAVKSVWHRRKVEILSLREVGRCKARVRQVEYEGRVVIAKIARFDWEIDYVERETIAYHRLKDTDITPKFLGHLTEDGRVMGFLLEKVEGRNAVPKDIKTCRTIAKKVHEAGLVHGDLNKYNFVLGKKDVLLDFEHAQEFDAELAQQELHGLVAQLEEESGRGKGSP